MAAQTLNGLQITHEGNIARIHCGQDIDRALRIQLLREQRKMCQETDSRRAKAPQAALSVALENRRAGSVKD
jgi:hypothetical protein